MPGILSGVNGHTHTTCEDPGCMNDLRISCCVFAGRVKSHKASGYGSDGSSSSSPVVKRPLSATTDSTAQNDARKTRVRRRIARRAAAAKAAAATTTSSNNSKRHRRKNVKTRQTGNGSNCVQRKPYPLRRKTSSSGVTGSKSRTPKRVEKAKNASKAAESKDTNSENKTDCPEKSFEPEQPGKENPGHVEGNTRSEKLEFADVETNSEETITTSKGGQDQAEIVAIPEITAEKNGSQGNINDQVVNSENETSSDKRPDSEKRSGKNTPIDVSQVPTSVNTAPVIGNRCEPLVSAVNQCESGDAILKREESSLGKLAEKAEAEADVKAPVNMEELKKDVKDEVLVGDGIQSSAKDGDQAKEERSSSRLEMNGTGVSSASDSDGSQANSTGDAERKEEPVSPAENSITGKTANHVTGSPRTAQDTSVSAAADASSTDSVASTSSSTSVKDAPKEVPTTAVSTNSTNGTADDYMEYKCPKKKFLKAMQSQKSGNNLTASAQGSGSASSAPGSRTTTLSSSAPAPTPAAGVATAPVNRYSAPSLVWDSRPTPGGAERPRHQGNTCNPREIS